MHASKHTENYTPGTTAAPWRRSSSFHRAAHANLTVVGFRQGRTSSESLAPPKSDGCSSPSPISLLKERDSLIRSNQQLENFAACAAHDLKSPLNAALGWLRSIQSQPEQINDSQLKHALGVIERNIKKSLQQVNDILCLAKLNQPPKTLSFCNVNKIIDDVLAIHSDKIGAAHGKVKRMEFPRLRLDEHQFFFVFSNLIENAIKYKDNVRLLEIEIGLEDLGTSYELYVKDNGKGIPEVEIENVFELFATVPNSSTVDSTGIGLSYCKKVIRLHGGKIWAESDKNLGTTIRFTIPK